MHLDLPPPCFLSALPFTLTHPCPTPSPPLHPPCYPRGEGCSKGWSTSHLEIAGGGWGLKIRESEYNNSEDDRNVQVVMYTCTTIVEVIGLLGTIASG